MAEVIEYPFEMKVRPAIAANEFNFNGYLQAQGRAVMEVLQKAQREHPAVQANDGIAPALKEMTKDGKTVRINAPYRVMADGKESWAGLDDLKQWEKRGWKQVEHVDYTMDPKDARIKELEEQVKGTAKRDAEIAELREQVRALMESNKKKT